MNRSQFLKGMYEFFLSKYSFHTVYFSIVFSIESTSGLQPEINLQLINYLNSFAETLSYLMLRTLHFPIVSVFELSVD